ncbi:MAG TPA: dihydroorotate dehydrogenase electron transfer subunit [Mycobacteriales bacterium]|nr:dihydroorotate dehydrogenase electron transfer subunit [Mycobacteriales bacterium]
MSPVQVRGEVLTVKQMGAYHAMTVVASGIAEHTRPGQFVAVAVGGEGSAMLCRRAFSVYQVRERGVYGGTVEFVFAVTGQGTAWLARQRPHDPIDVVGPLGRPFGLPRSPANCLLVGGGYGSAPLFPLAEALRGRGCRVDVVLGAATADRLFGALDAKRMAASVVFTTEDGSYGEAGRVSDVLADIIDRTRTEVVYACGPMPMLEAVTRIAAEADGGVGIPVQVAVEESMACGIGVCMTCVLPVVGDDGVTRMVRSCVEGPVFRGERVRWPDLGSVPGDALGALAGAEGGRDR